MTIWQLLALFFAHWVADFLLQPHWMASTKSKNFSNLVLHVIIYTLVMAISFGILTGLDNFGFAYLILLSSHLVIDFGTSKLTSYQWENKKLGGKIFNLGFFSTIGWDQFLHHAVIFYICWHGLN